MDTLINVAHGFGVALQPVNLIYCFIGVFIGTLVGVLPGIGPISAMSLLLPITLSGTPESGIIMMAGIYYGSMYGGSTTSILVNIPGEAASVVTCIDGHQMAKQGRAGPALGISAFGSFFAGTFALVALMLVAPKLASVAIAFGPAEYFSLMVLGLVMLTFLTQGSMAKALLMACLGVVLGLVGLDSINAQPRLTFGDIHLIDGVGIVPLVMGLFGVTEPPTVPPRVGGFLLASCLVDPLAQPRGSAYRRRSHLVHRPAFLVVPEVNDEDRLGAGVVHPDDSHRGASCQG